ncbi:U4/U6.U5 tri-snRNP-associated protein 1 [Ochlerotatus camptorhynchus]|uniref:U4/U6.U5 tri-snRNP-associated protein 1 n=1 Tax=Ochlerotatus camptorhynchus TaxID=644619 RepID=UPI0031D18A68
MGSSKKHKKESKKHKRRSRSRSPQEKRSRSFSGEDEVVEEYPERYRKESTTTGEKSHRHKKHKKERSEHKQSQRRTKPSASNRYEEGNGQESGNSSRHRREREREYVEVAEDSDSSDCIEVPVDDDIPPPPPPITRRVPSPEPERRSPSPPPRVMASRRRTPSPPRIVITRRRTPSPPRVAVSRRRTPSPPRVAVSRRRTPSPPRVAVSRRRTPSPPKVALPRRRSPSPPRVTVPRRRSPSPPPAPPPIKISRRRSPTPPPPPSVRQRSPSPVSANGAGDVLSIEETNKLRAKLGLKPLEVGPSTIPEGSSSQRDEDAPKDAKTGKSYERIKDDLGEFYHKPASSLTAKTKEEKIREKLKERKERRAIEDKLKKVKTLGEDEEMDDLKSWAIKTRDKHRLKKEADQRAKLLDQLDEEFGVGDLVDQEVRDSRREAYKERDLRGLRVEHDVEEFQEGRQVILTLKDADVLDEEVGDTLVNVNMIDDERYKKNVEKRKQKPNQYGYDVYNQDDVDEFGFPKERDVLGKYDEEIGGSKKSSFTIGSNAEHDASEKRRQLEIRAKLQNKKLDSLDIVPLTLASEYYNEIELASFKKPKKKVRKIRQKLRPDDLLAAVPESSSSQDLGSRSARRSAPTATETELQFRIRRQDLIVTDDTPFLQEDLTNVTVEEDDEDLQAVLSRTRRLKQKEALISKALPFDPNQIKKEIKPEMESDEENSSYDTRTRDGAILLNATAEFCRTLGDIPTYGLAGNREEDVNEMMDFEQHSDKEQDELEDRAAGTWNSVNTEQEQEELGTSAVLVDDVAILDEEPDVASSVAGALQLAQSKGYLEKEESNRPSNARFAHLQAQNYSIEDKNYGDDDKYSRRDRFSGPIMDFKERETFKPNVKLEYIDDNGHLLTPKEAFRYLSHKFHGKGPGKNKVEKRLKKNEQEGLMKKMSSTDTPLGTLNMLQLKQKETQSAFVVLSGSKQNTSIVKHKR